MISLTLLSQLAYTIEIFKNPPAGKDLGELMYAHGEFLQQHTEMWMWFPCDQEKNILTVPIYGYIATPEIEDDSFDAYNHALSEYNEAKARCLFEAPTDALVPPNGMSAESYIDGICMHCYDLESVVNAGFKLILTDQTRKKLFYERS